MKFINPFNAVVVLTFLFAVSLSLGAAKEGKMNICDVDGVHSGNGLVWINLSGCKGDLDFTTKTLRLEHHVMERIETRVGNEIRIHYVDSTGDVLAMKQTAEMARLFGRPVRVQFDDPKKMNVPNFMSIVGRVDLMNYSEWKPVPPKPNR